MGVNQKPQVAALERGLDVVVATPGRLLDLHGQGFVNFDKIEFFVLDEADCMLDMGFIHDIRKVLDKLPPNVRICSFRRRCRVKSFSLRIDSCPTLFE